MLVTLLGMVTLVRNVPANASAPMLVTLLPMVTLIRPVPANASTPMLVTLLGMVTLVSLVPLNASTPMLVTGRPPMAAGMLTAPLSPLYPVMVIVPLVAV